MNVQDEGGEYVYAYLVDLAVHEAAAGRAEGPEQKAFVEYLRASGLKNPTLRILRRECAVSQWPVLLAQHQAACVTLLICLAVHAF